MPTRHDNRKNQKHRRDERRKVAIANIEKNLKFKRNLLAQFDEVSTAPEIIKDLKTKIKRAETCLENTQENLKNS